MDFFMVMGRPLKFDGVEALEAACNAYFKSCHGEDGSIIEPYTITGLALALDTTRQTLCDYAGRDDFSDAIRKAKLRVENYAEKHLYTGKNVNGATFALKNFGWKDTQTLAGDSENPLTFKDMSERDVDSRLAELLGKTGAAVALGAQEATESEE